ncbi:hypothetical protein R50076_35340 [Gilvimarinus japonicus]
MKPRKVRNLFEIYQAPLVIFTLTLFGLIATLITEGWVDIVGVIATASSLLIIIWIFINPRPHT